MALKEYKPGTAFTGVIGRTFDVSSPAWPEPLRAKAGRAQRAVHRAGRHGLRPARLLRQPDQDAEPRRARQGRPALQQHAHDGAVLADPLVHADRPQPPLERDVVHHRGVDRLSRRQRQHPVRERLPVRDPAAARLQHLRDRQVAPDAGRPDLGRRPYDRWPLGRGFERYYGFLGGDTHQYYPELVYDNHGVEPEKTPEEGYHLTEDLVDHAISFIADAKQVAPDKPFFMYFCPGAMHAPHHVPKEWADKYKGKFDEGWDVYREKVFARQKELGIIPKDAELSRHDPDVQEWDRLSADEKRLYARMMEVFAGLPRAHRPSLRPAVRVPEDDRRVRQHAHHVHLRQRRQRRGRPDRLGQREQVLQQRAGVAGAEPGGDRRARRAEYFNHYPWGWTFAGNTPFRRWKRETYRGGISDPFIVHWPKGIKAKGEIRTQYAHAIDMVPTVLEALGIEPPTRSRASRSRRSRASASRTRSNDAKAPIEAHHAVLRDDGPPLDLSRRLARGVPVARHVVHGGRARASARRSTRTSSPSSTPRAGSSTTSSKDFAENHNLAGENRAKLIEMIAHVVRRGRQVQRPADRLARHAALRRAAPADCRRPQELHLLSRARRRCRTTRPTGAQPAAQHHRRRRDPEGRRRGRAALGRRRQGGYSFYVQDGKLHYAYNYVGSDVLPRRVERRGAGGPAQAALRVRADRQARRQEGKGAPGRGQLYIDGKLVGQVDMPLTMPLSLGLGGGVVCGAEPGSPVTDEYKPPFKFTGTLYSATVDVSGELIKDNESGNARGDGAAVGRQDDRQLEPGCRSRRTPANRSFD